MELQLDEWPSQTLAAVESWLWELIPKGRVALGGGTVLAARWNHRRSTDVDLFYTGKLFDELDLRRLAASLDAIETTGGLRDFRLAEDALTITIAGGLKVSIAPDDPIMADPLQRGECAMGLPVHSTLEISRRKMTMRVFARGTFKQRDFHDFAVCALEDADTARALLGGIRTYRSQGLAKVLEEEPDGFREQPLIGPFKYPWLVESADLRAHARVLLQHGVDEFLRRSRPRRNQRGGNRI